jgi:hypothetical protein
VESVKLRQFQKNEKLEVLLKEINTLLGIAENTILEKYSRPRYPIIFIVGSPRAGTTVMLQWLASTGKFGYPTNLLSRFYAAPYIGTKIQELLTDRDYNFFNEICEFRETSSFVSHYGKTQGALEPHEFWYFWRRFFPQNGIEYIDEKSLERADSVKFLKELSAWEDAINKPLALKALLLNGHLEFLSKIFKSTLFIYIVRHPFYNCQSLLSARVNYNGNMNTWFSFKPREYDILKDLDPYRQVAGQVYYTNAAIESQLEKIDSPRRLHVRYEKFCKNPSRVFEEIMKKLSLQGHSFNWSYEGQANFLNRNRVLLPQQDCQKIIEAYKSLSGRDIKP